MLTKTLWQMTRRPYGWPNSASTRNGQNSTALATTSGQQQGILLMPGEGAQQKAQVCWGGFSVFRAFFAHKGLFTSRFLHFCLYKITNESLYFI